MKSDKYSFKAFSSFILVMTTIIATEILPDSSDTTTVNESVISEIPKAAMWREPVVFSKLSLLDKTKYAPAQTNLSPRTMTAPSCSGVFGVKILINNSCETSLFNMIARDEYWSSVLCFSIVIKPPIESLESNIAALTISFLVLSLPIITAPDLVVSFHIDSSVKRKSGAPTMMIKMMEINGRVVNTSFEIVSGKNSANAYNKIVNKKNVNKENTLLLCNTNLSTSTAKIKIR